MEFPLFSYSIIPMFLLIFFSLQHCSLGTTTSNLILESCEKAAKTDPNLSHEFCVENLGADPKSKDATSLEELAAASIELTIANATEICSDISRLLLIPKRAAAAAFTVACLNDCLQLYSDAVSSLRDARRDFRRKDFEGVNVEISSAMDAPSSCEDGFEERRVGGGGIVVASSPLTLENQVFFQWTVVSLAFTNMSARK